MNTIELLEKMLKDHDWYYAMSDNHQVWKSGEAHIAMIREQINIADKEGLGEQAKDLYKKYAPK